MYCCLIRILPTITKGDELLRHLCNDNTAVSAFLANIYTRRKSIYIFLSEAEHTLVSTHAFIRAKEEQKKTRNDVQFQCIRFLANQIIFVPILFLFFVFYLTSRIENPLLQGKKRNKKKTHTHEEGKWKNFTKIHPTTKRNLKSKLTVSERCENRLRKYFQFVSCKEIFVGDSPQSFRFPFFPSVDVQLYYTEV